jgi:nucleoside-diphosphate-sugar epimerase
VNDLVREIGEIVGNKARVKYVEKQKGDVRDTWADVGKANEMLNWKPGVNIDKGLKMFVKWFSEHCESLKGV